MIKKSKIKNQKSKNVAFSMVELLVVITIIMVVTAVGVISYQGANKKSRDAKRSADLEKVRVALELYRQENGFYPDDQGDLVSSYLQVWPADPKGYVYVYNRQVGSSFTYTLDAYLEVGTTTGTYATDCGGVACNYRVLNP